MGIIYFTAVYDFQKVCVSEAATIFLCKKKKKQINPAISAAFLPPMSFK